ncbi:3'-5' exonuclease [Sphingobacterium siyangense]|uniref:3'-5' exonuclease n=1 Tax=Sphingobacterium siyangense TaxID=459529 RepID=UPI003DA286D4
MSYYFTLPLITALTPDQRKAVDETKPLALSGGPGTGKSLVSLWRHITNHSTGLRNSLLLTYTKTLEHYLKANAITQSENAGYNIDRAFWWLSHNAKSYDEIIIDEGQDIRKETFQIYFNYSNVISYGADEKQIMFLKPDEWEELTNWFETDNRFKANREFGKIELQRNFRNSREILLFSRSIFPNILIRRNTLDDATVTGLKPIMKLNLGWGIENQINAIIDIINTYKGDTHNIAVLIPFAKDIEDYYNLIKKGLDKDEEITKYQHEDEEFNGLAAIHITTFRSSKGTEFDTVIIPEFHRFRAFIDHPTWEVTENDYYVAFTRTKTNLFLLCQNGFPDLGDTINIDNLRNSIVEE